MFYAPYFLLPDTLISPLVDLWQYNGRVLELTLRRIVRFLPDTPPPDFPFRILCSKLIYSRTRKRRNIRQVTEL